MILTRIMVVVVLPCATNGKKALRLSIETWVQDLLITILLTAEIMTKVIRKTTVDGRHGKNKIVIKEILCFTNIKEYLKLCPLGVGN